MQTAMRTYTELISTTNPIEPPYEPPQMRAPTRALLARAHERGPLELRGPWRLHPSVSRALDAQAGITPPGGWAGLASVLAGAGVLQVRGQGISPLISLEELEGWSDQELRRRLIEALTLRLVPPATAAGLFLLVGIHPAWGLRLANAVHERLGLEDPDRDPPQGPGTLGDPTLFPQPVLRALERGVFGGISALFEALRTLDAGRAYPLEALGELVWQVCQFVQRFLRRERPARRAGELGLFIDHLTDRFGDASQRALDFAMLDLVDHLLVPAGAARRFDEQTFCIWPEAIPGGVEVFGQPPLEQGRWLCRLLTGEAQSMVA